MRAGGQREAGGDPGARVTAQAPGRGPGGCAVNHTGWKKRLLCGLQPRVQCYIVSISIFPFTL